MAGSDRSQSVSPGSPASRAGSVGSARTRRSQVVALVAFLLLSVSISALGGLATSTSVGTWYQMLAKPAFNPPDWVFAPVWTALFLIMAIAGWRVWRTPPSVARTRALRTYGVQLVLNLGWSVTFFWMRSIGLALIEISIFWLSLVATTVLIWRMDRIAGMLFLPYLAWVSYAVVLNAALWHMN